MRKVLWNVFLLMLFPLAIWQIGTGDKYPELVFPLFLIWLAVISPYIENPNVETYVRQRALEKYRKTAAKYKDDDLVKKIDLELRTLHDWSTPVTVGSLKSVLGYEGKDNIGIWEIEKRIAKIKAGKV